MKTLFKRPTCSDNYLDCCWAKWQSITLKRRLHACTTQFMYLWKSPIWKRIILDQMGSGHPDLHVHPRVGWTRVAVICHLQSSISHSKVDLFFIDHINLQIHREWEKKITLYQQFCLLYTPTSLIMYLLLDCQFTFFWEYALVLMKTLKT